jgi:Ca2+:H+ antiporter
MVAASTPWWTWAWPGFAWLILLMTSLLGGGIIAAVAGVALLGTVFAAVYHAEVVAHRVGEPFGTLVLALAVTVIETAVPVGNSHSYILVVQSAQNRHGQRATEGLDGAGNR